jgi:hypothetical protein
MTAVEVESLIALFTFQKRPRSGFSRLEKPTAVLNHKRGFALMRDLKMRFENYFIADRVCVSASFAF